MAKKQTVKQPPVVDVNLNTTEIPDQIAIANGADADLPIQSTEELTLNINAEEQTTTDSTTTTTEEPVVTTEETVVNTETSTTTEEPVVTPEPEVPAQEEPVVEAAVVAEEPVVEPVVEPVQDVAIGAVLLPNDQLHSDRLESALGTLRSTENLSPNVIAQAQVALYNTLTHYFQRREYDEIAELITNLMAYMAIHRDNHFTPTTIFRGFDRLSSLNQSQNMEFRMLMRILVDLAPEATRTSVAKDINWESIHSQWHPDRSDKMIGFFRRFLNLN